jgi:hypothetical protein
MFSLVCGSIGVTLQAVAQAASPRQFFAATKFGRGVPERTHRREAWLYVASRVAHSLVQATINVVMLRFAIFMAATLVLLAMSIRAALIVF